VDQAAPPVSSRWEGVKYKQKQKNSILQEEGRKRREDLKKPDL
jgi:hypothetical protein